MANNSKPQYRGKYNGPTREVKCSCGGTSKLRTKKSYPFGKKSGGKSISFYKCQSCGKRFN